jgi:hypothetical protein
MKAGGTSWTRVLRWIKDRLAATAVAAAVCVASFLFYDFDVPFLGDEPSYLVYATSLSRGLGVDLRRVYETENLSWISTGPIESHAQVWHPGGPVASWHGIGLPILLSPFAGRLPPIVIRAFMILIASLLAYHLFALVRATTGASAIVAAVAVLGIMASPPIIFHASLVYPEVLAGLLVVVALRSIASQRPVRVRLLGAGVAAAFLPWLNVRYATLTLGLALIAAGHAYDAAKGERFLQRLTSALRLVIWPTAAGLVILGGLVVFNYRLYGGLWPSYTHLGSGYNELRNLYVYGIGGLIGSPLGIIPFSPLLLVAFVAVPVAALRVGRRAAVAVSGLVLGYWGVSAYFGSAGFTLPGRYFVTCVPLLAIPLAVAILDRGWAIRFAVVIAAILSTWSTLTSAAHLSDLYASEPRNIRPFGLTQHLWPIALDEAMESFAKTELSGVPGQVASQVGMLEQVDGATWLIARQDREPLGVLSFGPYDRLLHGRYEAAFDLMLAADRPVPPAQVEVVDSGGRFFATADVPFPSTGSLQITKRIEFLTDGQLPVGLRVIYKGSGTLGVRKIHARLIERLPKRAEGEVWKAVCWVIVLTWISTAWWRRTLRSRTAA